MIKYDKGRSDTTSLKFNTLATDRDFSLLTANCRRLVYPDDPEIILEIFEDADPEGIDDADSEGIDDADTGETNDVAMMMRALLRSSLCNLRNV